GVVDDALAIQRQDGRAARHEDVAGEDVHGAVRVYRRERHVARLCDRDEEPHLFTHVVSGAHSPCWAELRDDVVEGDLEPWGRLDGDGTGREQQADDYGNRCQHGTLGSHFGPPWVLKVLSASEPRSAVGDTTVNRTLSAALLRGGRQLLVDVVRREHVRQVGLMVATALVVPEDVRTLRVSGRAFRGGTRPRHLAVHDAAEHLLAVVRVDRYVHPGGGEVLDAAADAVLGLVAATGEQDCQRHQEDHNRSSTHALPPKK